MERVDCVVIGGGVIGLAVAAAVAELGLEVVVLEKESRTGLHASSRNSGVIHAGIYYPERSLKARCCIAGRRLLYGYCERHGVAHRRIGKLIVATNGAEIPTLEHYYLRAQANGVEAVKWLSKGEIEAKEPAVAAEAAIESPVTGIIDSHELMLALQADVERRGGHVLCRHSVTAGSVTGSEIRLVVNDGRDEVACHSAINAAGLFATDVARSIDGIERSRIPQRRNFLKSHFFKFSGKPPFERLIYPVAPPGVAGIHSISRLDGGMGFGPDVEAVEEAGYDFDDSRRDLFAERIRTYYPPIEPHQLLPDYAALGAALQTSAGPANDFMISRAGESGAAGRFWNLFAMDSPALTGSLAVAGRVAKQLRTAADV